MPLATHTGILSCAVSTVPLDTASASAHCSSTAHPFRRAHRFGVTFSPGHLRRTITRPVSYYALFECVAASKPTSWLSVQSNILSHLTRTWGP